MKNFTNKKLTGGDKTINLNTKSVASSLLDFENELNYLNKLEITSGNISSITDHGKNIIRQQNENLLQGIEIITKEIEKADSDIQELRTQLFEIEQQHDTLSSAFKNCNERRQKYHSDIIKLRRENTKEFDNKLNILNKNDKVIRAQKKELFLLINLLKFRIVNLDTINEDKIIKGYLINTERNAIKYIEIKKEEQNEIESCKLFWNSMNNLLSINKNCTKLEKENYNSNNLK